PDLAATGKPIVGQTDFRGIADVPGILEIRRGARLGAVRPTMGFPVAAKSGTTTDFKDAWYIGYTSDLAVASWMGRTVTKPAPHNESMTGPAGGLWGEIGPASSWRQFVRAYYGSKKPADWARPTDVSTMTLCKLTGQPAPADLSPELAI